MGQPAAKNRVKVMSTEIEITVISSLERLVLAPLCRSFLGIVVMG
jgi:hypothetical protein